MQKQIVFDFGGMSFPEIRRTVDLIDEQGFGHFAADSAVRDKATNIGGQFIHFLGQLFVELGLIQKDGSFKCNPMEFGASEVNSEDSPEEVMREVWNQRAHSWGIIETPVNYAATMQTLLEFFRVSRKPENILSLGSGPGLYEIYLAYLFQHSVDVAKGIHIIATDYSKDMVLRSRDVISKVRVADSAGELHKLKNIEVQLANMCDLRFASGTMNQIICNNSLQWAGDWRKAISEMARVMDPKGLGWLYLIVHTHPMRVYDGGGRIMFEFGNFEIPELLDEMESKGFCPTHLRQILGTPGTGQSGTMTSRVFIQARFEAKGCSKSWRSKQVSSAISALAL